MIQAGSEILLSAIHKLINSICNKGELLDQWKVFSTACDSASIMSKWWPFSFIFNQGNREE
jgi:hypothetical protein